MTPICLSTNPEGPPVGLPGSLPNPCSLCLLHGNNTGTVTDDTKLGYDPDRIAKIWQVRVNDNIVAPAQQ